MVISSNWVHLEQMAAKNCLEVTPSNGLTSYMEVGQISRRRRLLPTSGVHESKEA